jgi:hypothetical protein
MLKETMHLIRVGQESLRIAYRTDLIALTRSPSMGAIRISPPLQG